MCFDIWCVTTISLWIRLPSQCRGLPSRCLSSRAFPADLLRSTCDRERNLSDDQIKRIAERGGLIGNGYWDTAICDPSLERIVTALRYVADLVGVAHVALGSDYDGSTEVPFHRSELSALTQYLIKTGFKEDAVRRIMGQNTIDFLLENLPRRVPRTVALDRTRSCHPMRQMPTVATRCRL